MNNTRANSRSSRHAVLSVWLCAVVLAGIVCLPALFADPPPISRPTKKTEKGSTEPTSTKPASTTTKPKTQQRIASPAEIAQWVEQLGAKSFKVRKLATKRLAESGGTAIPAVQDVGLDTKIEAALRAVEVLKRIYVASRDGMTTDKAEVALLKLKDNANKSVGRRASKILQQNYPIRQARAVERIRELGGQVEFKENPFMIVRDVDRPAAGFVYAVAIDGKWKGTEEDYAQINRLDSVSVLYLIKGHKISEKRLATLHQALPDLKVQERGRSFLGVGTRLDVLGCRIGHVQLDSAAREGGLQQDDIVVEIGGKAVASPDDLIEIIGNAEPSEKLKIVVLRARDPFIRTTLIEFRDDPTAFKPLLAIGILNELRRDIFVTLKPWNINN